MIDNTWLMSDVLLVDDELATTVQYSSLTTMRILYVHFHLRQKATL